MASTTIPRFLLPRGGLYLRDPRLQYRLAALNIRHASTANPSKPRVLEKPAKFNPPSHPARLRRTPKAYPGPALSEPEREAQKTRQYPHMMPPEGSFWHWFLTNRLLHTYISLVGFKTRLPYVKGYVTDSRCRESSSPWPSSPF